MRSGWVPGRAGTVAHRSAGAQQLACIQRRTYLRPGGQAGEQLLAARRQARLALMQPRGVAGGAAGASTTGNMECAAGSRSGRQRRVGSLLRGLLGQAAASAAGAVAGAALLAGAWRALRGAHAGRGTTACSMQVMHVDLPPPCQLEVPAMTQGVATAGDQQGSVSSTIEDVEAAPIKVYYFPDGARTGATRRALKRALGDVAASAGGVVGLDAEWQPETPGSQHPISLVQIASHSAVVLLRPGSSMSAADSLFGRGPAPDAAPGGPGADGDMAASQPRYSRHAGHLPAELDRMLGDPGVIKAGMGILEDVRRLHRDCGTVVRVRGCMRGCMHACMRLGRAMCAGTL